MSGKNVMICDRESLFADKLGENVSARSELALKVYTCTSVEKVKEFQQKKKVHILIIDEKFIADERKEIEAEQICVLTKDTCKDLRQGEKEIYKYQNADVILSEVFETYCEGAKDTILKSVRKKKKRLITVYSPIHRVGKTTFSLALGQELALKEKTLYLNFEEYAYIASDFGDSKGRNLGDLIYFMCQENGQFLLHLSNAIRKKGNMDYVPPILDCIDLKEVTADEWQRLLQKLLDESVYETILLDMSESVQGLYEILQRSDKIYMPVLEDSISINKINRYEENLKKHQCEEILEKTSRILMTDEMKKSTAEELAKEIAKEEM